MLTRLTWTPSHTRLHAPRTRPTTTSLCDLAESEGIAIVWARDQPDQARWHEGPGVISVRYGMTERRTVSVIAHELGHWWHGDWCSDPVAERRAWKFAGALLVDPTEYAAAEQRGDHPGALARELGVLTDVIHGYRAEIRAHP